MADRTEKTVRVTLAKQWEPRKERKSIKLAVCGSRTLKDERVKIMLLEEIEKHGVTDVVTHAEPDGVCGVARKLCKEKSIPLTLHFLNFKYLRGAFEHRTKAVFLDCDRTILIHDGRSKGTSNELKVAKKMGIPYAYHVLEVTKYEASVGFDIETEWGVNDLEIEFNGLEELMEK